MVANAPRQGAGIPDTMAGAAALIQAGRYGIPVGQVQRVMARDPRLAHGRSREEATALPHSSPVPMITFLLPVPFVRHLRTGPHSGLRLSVVRRS